MSAPVGIGRPIRVIAFVVALVAVAGAGAVPTFAQPTPEDVLSHMLCYTGSFRPFDPVNVALQDQFGASQALVGGPRLLCNPVRKTRRSGEVTTIVDRRQHLKAYAIRSSLPQGFSILISVGNQFAGDQELRISTRPTRLLVPTRKAPHEAPEGLDHFLCYPVLEGRAVDKRVALRDQFDSFRTSVGKPRLHCNPVAKTHPPDPPGVVINDFAHLVCYGIERHKLDPAITRRTRNQFERARVRAEVAALLCVPSTKAIV